MGIIDAMMNKAVKMQKSMMEIYEKEAPDMYAKMTNKPVFCSYCGSKNDRADNNCTACGASIKQTESQTKC